MAFRTRHNFLPPADGRDGRRECREQRQQVVRQFTNPAWTNTTGGDVAWDGLDGLGRLVQDGTYRLRVVDSTGNNLGETPVDVDTNRRRSCGRRYAVASYTNLTCELPDPSGEIRFSSDDSTAFFTSARPLTAGCYPLVSTAWRATALRSGRSRRRFFNNESSLTPMARPHRPPMFQGHVQAVHPVYGQSDHERQCGRKNLKQLPFGLQVQNWWMSPMARLPTGD